MPVASGKSSNSIATVVEQPVNDIDPPPLDSIWAAGCVVTRRNSNGKPEYLLIRRERYKDWSLPKGKVDDGETFLEAALREDTGGEPEGRVVVASRSEEGQIQAEQRGR